MVDRGLNVQTWLKSFKDVVRTCWCSCVREDSDYIHMNVHELPLGPDTALRYWITDDEWNVAWREMKTKAVDGEDGISVTMFRQSRALRQAVENI